MCDKHSNDSQNYNNEFKNPTETIDFSMNSQNCLSDEKNQKLFLCPFEHKKNRNKTPNSF